MLYIYKVVHLLRRGTICTIVDISICRYNERGGERSPVPYRTVRDERERRPVSDHHTKSDIRSSREHRYADNAGGTVKGER